MLIYIIRHGETAFNRRRVLQGQYDEPLNENGRALGKLAGQGMKDIRFDACISSPLSRACETAELVLTESGNGEIPVETDDRLLEINFGSLEGTVLPPSERKIFFEDPRSMGTFPGGESCSDVIERTQEFLKELIARDDGRVYLLSTHGLALRAMLGFIYDDPGDFWHGMVPYNCAVSIVEAHNGRAELIGDDVLFFDRKYCVNYYKKTE